ncbi:hypothetical protein C8A01DRAFT_34899 [Parachaetomium inaequale]|uniref:F-box domain-containing protein n=1 Tax=Parachaetomium inaequale TaxID=2588326 RepID=A0AAN6PJE1_9PEZI|nr:hypothetical protein C8A01DRAFT_34899 [Parachaetomium inaequale]
MDKLPAEIIHLIISHLEPPLAGYATVSSRWQDAIESHTLRSIGASSDDASFGQFQAVFATPRRRALLRKLVFHVQLPPPSEKRIRKLQSRREAAANNLAYTRALVALFSYLHTWEHEEGAARLALEVSVSSPMDNYDGDDKGHRGVPIWFIRDQLRQVSVDTDVLRESGGLATVRVVSGLTNYHHIGLGCGRRVDPAVMPLVTKALPNAREMNWAFSALPRRFPDLRRAERMSLANALFATAAADIRLLTTLQISWEDRAPCNEASDPGSLVDGASSRDDLSIALRRISQLPSLRSLKLTGSHTIGAQLFEDQNVSPDHGAPTWPSLTNLEIWASVTTPDGRWYFTGDPSSAEFIDQQQDDSDESVAAFDSADADTSDFAPDFAWEREDGMVPWRVFRTTPDCAIFVPFMVSMLRAVARMPVLRHLTFCMQLESRIGVYLDYFGPGEPRKGPVVGLEPAFHKAHLEQF